MRQLHDKGAGGDRANRVISFVRNMLSLGKRLRPLTYMNASLRNMNSLDKKP